jgi:selenocysteine lyase/cysteine desulfurase
MDNDFWDYVRADVIGNDAEISTPFGKRNVIYADFTASGKSVRFIERYMENILELYGNTHTEDDATGSVTTQRVEQAEAMIKQFVNAGKDHSLIAVGPGTTGAVHRLQQIIGIYIPPVAKDFFGRVVSDFLDEKTFSDLKSHLLNKRPVIFVGPYEHHSNEVSWRECFAEVVEINLGLDGLLDLDDLRDKVSRPEYSERMKIGALSAASNVSGIVTPVYEVAKILHQHDALVFFDFAAIAPYRQIDMCKGSDCCFDAVYFSPHKFLGGPGSAGVLIIKNGIYRQDLPPTVGAGGTVDFVNMSEQQYNPDIEIREKSGTPGILQIMRTALAMQLKEKLDPQRIETVEHEYISRALEKFCLNPAIEVAGSNQPDQRLAIFSFNLKSGKHYLHPRYVSRLLNDLFGIQSRAGCSCAGPYGHRILNISEQKSVEFKQVILGGDTGVKPGWVRINFHFLMTEAEFNFVCDAVIFVAEYGKYFLPFYKFDLKTGEWTHDSHIEEGASFDLEDALEIGIKRSAHEGKETEMLLKEYLAQANEMVSALKETYKEESLKTTQEDLIPYIYVE